MKLIKCNRISDSFNTNIKTHFVLMINNPFEFPTCTHKFNRLYIIIEPPVLKVRWPGRVKHFVINTNLNLRIRFGMVIQM